MTLIEKARIKGTDTEYLDWLRCWPSCLSGAYSEVVNGEGKCEAAHVRRVASGAGVAIKPEYSAVPLTHDEHNLQHQKGESAFTSPEWFEREANRYLAMWINGIQPPELKEQKAHFKKEYIIEYPNQIIAIWMLLKKHFLKDNSPKIKLTIQRAVNTRSNKQNRAQWSVIYAQCLDYYKDNPIDLGTDALNSLRFGINVDFIHEMFKRMFLKGKSTAKLSTIESKEYFEKIREYFLHKYYFEIKEPIKEQDYE